MKRRERSYLAWAGAATVVVAVLSVHTATASSDFEGRPCDDHDPCTVADRFIDGMCRGDARSCDDGRLCTDDFCDPASGRCRSGLRIDHCFIDGQCYAEDETLTGDPCSVCNPSRSNSTWTTTMVCDDGDPCTADDRCTAGQCVGRPYSCPLGEGCKVSRCDGRGGCINEVVADRCVIDGLCFPGGTRHPYDPCLRCDPATSPIEWGDAEGEACPGGICQSGRCVASIRIETLGAGSGVVVGRGFSCRDDCLRYLAIGERVELTVIADPGSVFRGWSGSCVGIAPCNLYASGEMRLIALFEHSVDAHGAPKATLRVTRAGRGRVVEKGGRIACGDRCSADVTDGVALDLAAEAAPGYRFAGWGGGCSGSMPTCTVLVSGAVDVEARFESGPAR